MKGGVIMDRDQKIHEIACSALPVLYQQFIDNKGNPDEFDLIAEYKNLVNRLKEDKQIQ